MRQALVLALVVLVGVGTSIYLRSVRLGGDALPDRVLAQRLSGDAGAPSYGPADASVAITVFTDYQCPACRKAHGAMLAAMAKDGDTRIVFRDFPVFGQISQDAARVALATQEQGIYPQVHDALMRESRRLSADVMHRIVTREGGSWVDVLAAIERGGPSVRLDANRRDAMMLGVAGTPTYVIGRHRYVGALSETQFARAIARARQ